MQDNDLLSVDQAADAAWDQLGFRVTGDELWVHIQAGTGPVLASWRPRASTARRDWGRIAYSDLRDWVRHQRALLIKDAVQAHGWAKGQESEADAPDGTRIKLSGAIGGFQHDRRDQDGGAV